MEKVDKNILIDLEKKIKNGKLIIYPTDTVYGLGAIIENEDAIRNIYVAKNREFSSPLIALVSSIQKIEKIAHVPKNHKTVLENLSSKFWPGALTVILKKKENVPAIMVSNGKTIGVRIPNLKISRDIIELAGGVLVTTSANISGERSPKSFEELSDELKEKVDILVDSGKCDLGEVSTIVDLSGDTVKILRVGAISIREIEKIICNVGG